jgi:hypothetical protein
MPNLPTYTRATREARALRAALKCPAGSPWQRLGLRILRHAMREPTKRAAAARLGLDERELSVLLRELSLTESARSE